MSNCMNIAVLVGSLRDGSFNRMTAEAIEKAAGDRARFDYLAIGHLGLFNQDSEENWPDNWTELKQGIEKADGILIVTPEYNRSMPGVLKNAMDIASRPWGKNSFANKAVAVIGASPAKVGTAIAQQHVRIVLSYLDARVMSQPEAYIQMTDDGKLDEATIEFLGKYTDAMLEWFAKHG